MFVVITSEWKTRGDSDERHIYKWTPVDRGK
jgi:hypothetical protein